MRVKVIQTTDGNFLGAEFTINSFSFEEVETAVGRKFNFTSVKYKGDLIEIQSSNYTAILKIIE